MRFKRKGQAQTVRVTSWIACGLAVSVAACLRPDVTDSLGVVTGQDSSGVALVTISGPGSILPAWGLVQEPDLLLSGDLLSTLGTVGEIVLLGDFSLVVEDDQAADLKFFDSRGRLRRTVGRRGEGPGEFRNVTNMTVVAGDTIHVFDRGLQRVTMLDPEGGIVTTTLIGPSTDRDLGSALEAWPLVEGRELVLRPAIREETPSGPLPRRYPVDLALVRWPEATGAEAERVLISGAYQVEFEDGLTPVPFAPTPAVAAADGRVAYTSSVRYAITIADGGLRPRRKVQWSGWTEVLVEQHVSEVRGVAEDALGAARRNRPQFVENLLDAYFSASVLPDSIPAISRLLMDDVGRVWVSQFTPSLGRLIDEGPWHVLDTRGHPVARIEFGPRARLAAVRSDRVVLVVSDELGLESIRVHKINTAAPQRGSER